jgi:hypothetical protein
MAELKRDDLDRGATLLEEGAWIGRFLVHDQATSWGMDRCS